MYLEPSIRKWKKLPESRVMSRVICNRSFRYDFGYDESRDDYKLVVVFSMLDDNTKYKTEIKIYSLKNDKWRAVQGFQRDVIKGSAKFVKGKLYWTSFLSVQQHNTIIVATLFVLI